MPFTVTVGEAVQWYQDYEYADALADFFQAVSQVNNGHQVFLVFKDEEV